MAEYVKPKPGGGVCPGCGQICAACRILPPSGGCRIRYHRCLVCERLFKSVEKLKDEG